MWFEKAVDKNSNRNISARDSIWMDSLTSDLEAVKNHILDSGCNSDSGCTGRSDCDCDCNCTWISSLDHQIRNSYSTGSTAVLDVMRLSVN